jgi:hypothetical protein
LAVKEELCSKEFSIFIGTEMALMLFCLWRKIVTKFLEVFGFHVDIVENLLMNRSRGSSGSIVSDYGLDDRGSIPDRDREFFF